MTQAEFYADANVNYSMGYGLIRFLRTSKDAQLRDEWGKLPVRYFEALRGTWRKEAEKLALSGLTNERYGKAVARSRDAALQAALEGVDVDELEASFLAWVRRGSAD